MVSTTIGLGLVVVVFIYAIVIYNGLVNLKNGITKAWSNIDVLLVQRHDELPKLVETCKQYMQFERDTLEKVMTARSAVNSARQNGDVKGVGEAQGAIRNALSNISATVEAYPELRANQAIMQLMGRITGLENAISDRREFYNEAVNANNVRIAEFPDLLVARFSGFKEAALLQFSDEQKSDVDMRNIFRS
jgi:LemA protein